MATETHTKHRESQRRYERAIGSLSGGVSTGFRINERPVPLYFESASGARLVDVDGNEYIDYVCGYGPVILGHAHPEVTKAAAAAASMQQIGGQQDGEIDLAETLCRVIPGMERVRPSLSGSEAVHAVLRLARAATGRPLVVKFAGHYHGWLDNIYTATKGLPPAEPETLGQLPSAVGEIVAVEWNNEESLRAAFSAHGDRVAALIMEPFPCNGGVIPAAPGFLELCRQLTEDAGSILIFDEVITGFRVGLGGAHEILGVLPDLVVVAKAMANGFPISAFGGRADLMDLVSDNRVLHAGTYNGGGVSVAAALATIRALENEPIHERLNRLGARLRDGLEDVAADHGQALVAQGPGPVFFTWFTDREAVTSFSHHLEADHAAYARFAAAMLDEGVRIIPAGRWYLNAAHTDDDVDAALQAADRAFAKLGDGPGVPAA